MKKILTLTLLTILLFNSSSLVFSMKNPCNHQILTQALIRNEDPIYSKEQLQKNIELFKFALKIYKPIYTNNEYEKEVQIFYKDTQYLYQQELLYLKKIYQNITSILTTQNYSEIPNIYSITFNPNHPKKDFFGHDFYHKPHAIKVRALLNRAIKNKIGYLLTTEIFDEYNQTVLENIEDGFLLAAILIEGLKWTGACINFLQKQFNS